MREFYDAWVGLPVGTRFRVRGRPGRLFLKTDANVSSLVDVDSGKTYTAAEVLDARKPLARQVDVVNR